MFMTWRIVADSSCDLFDLPVECPGVEFATIPFIIRVGQTEYIDDEKISVDGMLTANENHREMAQTACPSPQAWVEEFSKPGNVLAFTISSNLSGSYNSACTAKQMVEEEQPGKRIAVIDTKATGPETVLIIRRACELIKQGLSIDEIKKALYETAAKTHIIFSLSSYHNLIKAGRVNRLVGLIAGHLGFWGIGVGDDNGEIAMRGKARGPKNMLKVMMEEIGRIGLCGSRVVISHSLNEEMALQLKERLLAAYPQITVDVIPCRGLDSFYAERHGLIAGF